MSWYVDSVLGAGNAPELFYSDPRVIAAFQTWVRARVLQCEGHRSVTVHVHCCMAWHV